MVGQGVVACVTQPGAVVRGNVARPQAAGWLSHVYQASGMLLKNTMSMKVPMQVQCQCKLVARVKAT